MIPVLLYGCENWVLTDANITTLESFQCEIGRRILRLSKSHSLLSTQVALQLQSIASRIFSRKLSLLHRVSTESVSLGYKIFSTLTPNCPRHSLSLSSKNVSLLKITRMSWHNTRGLRWYIYNSVCGHGIYDKVDCEERLGEKCLRDAQNHQNTAVAAEIASSTSCIKLWDMALDHGHQGTVALFRELTRPTVGSKPCHRCDIDHLHEPYFNHFISSSSHSTIGVSPTTIVRLLADGDRDVFMFAK